MKAAGNGRSGYTMPLNHWGGSNFCLQVQSRLVATLFCGEIKSPNPNGESPAGPSPVIDIHYSSIIHASKFMGGQSPHRRPAESYIEDSIDFDAFSIHSNLARYRKFLLI